MPTTPRIDIPPAREALPPVESCTLVIFGGSGDLARRRLIPALYNLLLDGLLPSSYAVLGLGRKSMTDEAFRAMAREGVMAYSRQALVETTWNEFAAHLFYIAGDNDDPNTFAALKSKADSVEQQFQIPGNRIFYLSIPPSSFTSVCEGLNRAGLVTRNGHQNPYTRIIVEKPVGRDLASARQINAVTGQVFDESQIFRIDHYLGKETVQNHLLQLLCLVAMEPPYSLDPNVVRNSKMEVLRCLRPIVGKDVELCTVRAQYAEGTAHEKPIRGYRREPGVNTNSTTETYVAVKCLVENWRWSGVPFYLRTGKALPRRASEVAVQFKDIPQILFNANARQPQPPNVLALRIQPEEGLSLRIVSRVPGTREQTHPVEMDFRYSEVFGRPSPEAYERLLLDVMAGDASRFMRRDAVEASWAWITQILDSWQQQGLRWLPEYQAGTWGPVEADRLIQQDGRAWRTL